MKKAHSFDVAVEDEAGGSDGRAQFRSGTQCSLVVWRGTVVLCT